MNFETKKCHKCGYALTELRDGKIIYLRCYCEWDRAFRARVKQAILPEFYTKTMADWDPPLFREGGYPEFLAAQLAMVPVRLFRFVFRENAIRRQVRGRPGCAGTGRRSAVPQRR